MFKTTERLLEIWMRMDLYLETGSERKLEWSFAIGLYLQSTTKSQHLQKLTVLWRNLNAVYLQYIITWILKRYSSIILRTLLLNTSDVFGSVNLFSHLLRCSLSVLVIRHSNPLKRNRGIEKFVVLIEERPLDDKYRERYICIFAYKIVFLVQNQIFIFMEM